MARTLKYPPPDRPLSRLERQHFNAGNFPMDIRPYDKLLADFGRWQDMTVGRDFPLSALLAHPPVKGRKVPRWGETYDWPACDHVVHFKRNRQPVAVLTQPYDSPDVGRLQLYAAEHGLSLHMPPNPFASFWFPGWTYFVLVTAPDFGGVNWLHDQLDFETQGCVT